MQTVPPPNGRRPRAFILLLCLTLVSGCVPAATGKDQPVALEQAREPARAAVADDGLLRIVAFGDSLTAGLGLPAEDAYPARLQERLESAGYRARVVNAGVSGETTAGGLRRMAWALEGEVHILILALGGNDGLRGLPVDQMQDNLALMIAAARDSGAQVLLAGMEAPPNLGADYTDRFRGAFERLAAEYDVAYLPFLLEGVAGIAELNQADGIHPNAEGAERVAAQVWSALEPMLVAAQGSLAAAARPGGS